MACEGKDTTALLLFAGGEIDFHAFPLSKAGATAETARGAIKPVKSIIYEMLGADFYAVGDGFWRGFKP